MFATNCSRVVPRLIDAGPPYRTYPLGFVSAQFPTRELSAGWHRLIVSAGDNVTTYWLGSNASGPNVSRVGFQADMRMLLAVGNRGVARPVPSLKAETPHGLCAAHSSFRTQYHDALPFKRLHREQTGLNSHAGVRRHSRRAGAT